MSPSLGFAIPLNYPDLSCAIGPTGASSSVARMNLTETEVIALVLCPRCLALDGRACRPTGARCREGSATHEARWRRAERELRAARLRRDDEERHAA
jgi:hypothetical protein